jgi:hypothetical protein
VDGAGDGAGDDDLAGRAHSVSPSSKPRSDARSVSDVHSVSDA